MRLTFNPNYSSVLFKNTQNYSRLIDNATKNYGIVLNASSIKADSNESFASVAARARAFLDAAYKRLGATADEHTSGKTWREDIRLSQLDRRALYAIKSDYGGMFSGAEVSASSQPINDWLKQAEDLERLTERARIVWAGVGRYGTPASTR